MDIIHFINFFPLDVAPRLCHSFLAVAQNLERPTAINTGTYSCFPLLLSSKRGLKPSQKHILDFFFFFFWKENCSLNSASSQNTLLRGFPISFPPSLSCLPSQQPTPLSLPPLWPQKYHTGRGVGHGLSRVREDRSGYPEVF